MLAEAGQRASFSRAAGSESAISSSTAKPFCARSMAGAIRSASDNLPEPYFACASARPATVPGTPTLRPLSRDFFGSGLPLASRNMVGVAAAGAVSR